MKNGYYKDQNKQNYKFILIVLFVLVFILLLLLTMVGILKSKDKENQISPTLSFDNLTTVKEVIEYYKSTYISEEVSKKTSIYMDYYLVLKYLPYEEDDTSNEKYYNDLLTTSARILGYRSFCMIDNKNNIEIEVSCNNGKISKITINGIEDYFIYMDSQIDLKSYEEIPITDISVDSAILNECLNKNWESNIYFGERISIFDEYYIYLNEGIKVRTINNQIYNIVFNTNYKENVINGLFPGIDLKNVKFNFGDPSFESEDGKIIGYKGNRIYVFFTEDEISIYRNLDTDIEDFWKLVDEFIDENIDFLEFMNQLTYLWPDYSKYTYSSDSVFLSYPSKGIEIKLNYDDISGILVYNNIKSSLTKAGRYLENTNFVSRLKIDSVFETEKRRINDIELDKKKSQEYSESLDSETRNIIGESMNYEIYPEVDASGKIYSMKFISKDIKHANREINDSIDSYLWVTSDYFVYSKQKKGIYFFDLTTGNVRRILSGDKEFKLKGIENRVLKYDSDEIALEY